MNRHFFLHFLTSLSQSNELIDGHHTRGNRWTIGIADGERKKICNEITNIPSEWM